MKMYVLWILLCGAVGWGESKESKKPLYEAGLKSAWMLANFLESMFPTDDQVLPDLAISKVLYTPPYNKNVKLIHTAKEHTPVRITYLFQGATVADVDDRFHKGKWLCSIDVDEYFYDGEWIYEYPWNNHIYCEPDEDDEGGNPKKPPPPPPAGGPTKAPLAGGPSQPPKKQAPAVTPCTKKCAKRSNS